MVPNVIGWSCHSNKGTQAPHEYISDAVLFHLLGTPDPGRHPMTLSRHSSRPMGQGRIIREDSPSSLQWSLCCLADTPLSLSRCHPGRGVGKTAESHRILLMLDFVCHKDCPQQVSQKQGKWRVTRRLRVCNQLLLQSAELVPSTIPQ